MPGHRTEDVNLGEPCENLKFAREVAQALELPPHQKPGVLPEDYILPLNLGSLSVSELSRHLSMWTNICAYAQERLTDAEIQLTNAEIEYNRLFNKRLSVEPGDKVTEKKASVSNMKEVIAAEDVKVRAKAVQSTIKSLLDGYDRKYNAISREISLREKGAPREIRGDKYGDPSRKPSFREVDEGGVTESDDGKTFSVD